MDEQQSNIWQLQAQYDIAGLMNALASDDAAIRLRAAAALRKLRATKAIDALKTAMAAEDNAQTRAMMREALRTLGANIEEPLQDANSATIDRTLVERLVKQLQSDDSEQVTEAARKLGEIGDKMAVEPLVLLFNDAKRSIHVRLAVAEALLKLESAPVNVALLANLRHPDWHIRRNGAAILGQLKADWAIQPLSQALNDPDQTVRRTARAALKHIGTPEARKALAQDSSTPTRAPIKPTTSPLSPEQLEQHQRESRQEQADQPVAAPRSGLLQRVESDEAAQVGRTKPLDPDIADEADALTAIPQPKTRHHEPTMPIDLNMLDELMDDEEE